MSTSAYPQDWPANLPRDEADPNVVCSGCRSGHHRGCTTYTASKHVPGEGFLFARCACCGDLSENRFAKEGTPYGHLSLGGMA